MNTQENTPEFYEIGFEHSSVIDAGENIGRDVAGITYSEDKFWQYDELKDYSKRIIIYGHLALNNTETLLLHTHMNINIDNQGPSEVVIRLTYGGKWDELLGLLGDL